MKTHLLIAATVLVTATGAAFAGSTASLDSRHSAPTARWIPAGEGPAIVLPSTSTRSRTELRAEVDEARISGQLVAAGEGPVGGRTILESTLSRAQVKSEVLQARAAGDLVPAGEGVFAATSAGARHSPVLASAQRPAAVR